MNTITIGQWLKTSSPSSYYDRECILQYILNKSRSEIYLSWEKPLLKSHFHKCSDILFRYEKGEPLAYLLGEVEFYGYKFIMYPQVFIPRPETEILVSAVLNYYKNSPPRCFVDFGCGSGAIGLSLLKHWPKSNLVAVDKNKTALDLTLENAKKLNVKHHVQICRQNVLDVEIKDSVNLIVANPPYIARGDVHTHPSVVQYEPDTALFSEEGGMKDIQTWLHKACSLLSKSGGHYFFEIGYNQYNETIKILKNKAQIESFTVYKDYQGYKRVIHCSIKRKTG